MDQKQHKRRHITLHKALDELFADFIMHSGRKGSFTQAPILELINWSAKQSDEPDHQDNSNGE